MDLSACVSQSICKQEVAKADTRAKDRDQGVSFHLTALFAHLATMLLLPTFLLPMPVVRGLPVWLYRHDLDPAQRLPFALPSSVSSLGLVVAITEFGGRSRVMNPDIPQALDGAALLSALVYPAAAAVLGSVRAHAAR